MFILLGLYLRLLPQSFYSSTIMVSSLNNLAFGESRVYKTMTSKYFQIPSDAKILATILTSLISITQQRSSLVLHWVYSTLNNFSPPILLSSPRVYTSINNPSSSILLFTHRVYSSITIFNPIIFFSTFRFFLQHSLDIEYRPN